MIHDREDREYDEGEHIKEVFAHFGRAYYLAGVFETGLALAIMQLDFLTETMRRLRSPQGVSFNRKRYEADFDAFMEHQHAQTLGNLIKRAQRLASMPRALIDVLVTAKKERDFIAHHYFRERAVEFCRREWRESMIVELERAHRVFTEADRAVDAWMRPHRVALGLTDEMFQKHYEAFRAEFGLDADGRVPARYREGRGRAEGGMSSPCSITRRLTIFR